MLTEVINKFQKLKSTNPDMMKEVMATIPEDETASFEDPRHAMMSQATHRAQQVLGIVDRINLSDQEKICPELQRLHAEIASNPELEAIIQQLVEKEKEVAARFESLSRKDPAKMCGIVRSITNEDQGQLTREVMEKAIKMHRDLDGHWLRFRDLGRMASKGSLNHPHQCCPCTFFFYSGTGCHQGFDCEYCHRKHISNRAQKRRTLGLSWSGPGKKRDFRLSQSKSDF
jgi:hypothetical protein